MPTKDCKNYERVPQIADKVQIMDRELGEVSASSASAHKRVDKVEKKLDDVFELVEHTSDSILGHMKKEEGMYVIISGVLGVISLCLISMFAFIYQAHVDTSVLIAEQKVMIKNNNKLVNELIKDSKTFVRKK